MESAEAAREAMQRTLAAALGPRGGPDRPRRGAWPPLAVLCLLPFLVLPLAAVLAVPFALALAYVRVRRPKALARRLPPALHHALGLPSPAEALPLGAAVGNGVDDGVDATSETARATAQAFETRGMGWRFPFNYDVGVYWFAAQNRCEQGESNFDPDKPSVVYVHGWEPGTTARGFRETVNWVNGDVDAAAKFDTTHSLDAWLAAGFNVGVFYWNQLSDDPSVAEAERKIFNASDGCGMRWLRMLEDGRLQFVRPAPDARCAADLLADELEQRFAARDGAPMLHLVGHSLGSQLVLEATRRVVLRGRARLPTRLTLLDPFFSKGRKAYAPLHGLSTSQRAAETVNLLLEARPELLIETYETSLASALGGSAHRLRETTVFHQVDLHQFSWFQIGIRHICAPHVYFCSLAHTSDAWDDRFFNAHIPYDKLHAKMPRLRAANQQLLQAEQVQPQPRQGSNTAHAAAASGADDDDDHRDEAAADGAKAAEASPGTKVTAT